MASGAGFVSCFPHRGTPTRSLRRLTTTCATQKPLQQSFASRLRRHQSDLCDAIEALDGSGTRFCRDAWTKPDPAQGGGETCVLQGGQVFEKAAVNVSVVSGRLSPARAAAMRQRGRDRIQENAPFSAAALSIVFHAQSPLVPTLRGDVRVFEAGDEWWAGGGADLTPSYLFDEDAVEFHKSWRGVCARHGISYGDLKRNCDEYFFIPSRQEHRGVGGIFFDELNDGGQDKIMAFLDDIAAGWITSYGPIVERRKGLPYTDAQRHWQLLRRGRYLEFNLLNDRGVRFGLESGGRTESIMVSAPPLVRWDYNSVPAPGSEEERLVDVLKSPREWVRGCESDQISLG